MSEFVSVSVVSSESSTISEPWESESSSTVSMSPESESVSDIVSESLEEWEDEQNKAMQLVGEYKGYSPTLGGVMRLRRVQSQNIANCLHEITKIRLAKQALGDEKYALISKNGLTRKDGELKYIWTSRSNEPIDEIQHVLDVLAQTEHLRWNASHEILGYTPNENENFKVDNIEV